jgi:hypothetical protein
LRCYYTLEQDDWAL